jgi:tetratricopeptide (TPR) repeat protein
MLDIKIIIKRTAFLLTIWFSFNNLVAQQFAQTLKDPIDALKQKDYITALSQYEKLLKIYPKDASYHYYTGLCLTLLNIRLTEASEHFKFASALSITADAYYYLGYLSLWSYRFDEADNYFRKFIESSPKTAIDKQTGEQALSCAQNAKSYTKKTLVIKTISKKNIQYVDLQKAIATDGPSGRYIFMSEDMKAIAGLTTENPLIFMPSEMKPGDYVYFSANAGKRKGKDIFRMRKTGERQWTKPENIGSVINTYFDEDYPWFDAQNSALYFSSKGHNGMGGYDIFKSTYNWGTNTWSEPVNVGFPVNSPFDDFLYIPADSSKSVLFATSRFDETGKITLCKISAPETITTTALSDINMAKKAASLEVAFIPPAKENKTPINVYKPNHSVTNAEKAHPSVKTNPTKSPSKSSITVSKEERENYNSLLKEALLLQVKSDSVTRLADEKREIVQSSTKDEEITRLNKDIYQLKIKAANLQKEADKKYMQAREIEAKLTTDNIKVADINQEAEGDKPTDGPEVSNVNKKSTLYQKSTKKDTIASKKKGTQDQLNISKNEIKSNTNNINNQKNISQNGNKKPVSNNTKFEILNQSPYSDKNPIPVIETFAKGLIYKIQLGAFSKTVTPDRFRGLKPVMGEKITTNKGVVTKYYVGAFSKSIDSENALKQVREYGFKEAYIVAFYNGKNIPIEKAKKLEINP